MKITNMEKLNHIFKHGVLNLLHEGQLTIGIYANFMPIAYKSEKDNYIGMDVIIMKRFCKATGLKCKFVEVQVFDGIWFLPSQNKCDVSIGGIGMSAKRINSKTEWSIPYFYVDRTLVYNKEDPILTFPKGAHGIIRGTKNSIAWLDARERIEKSELKIKLLPSSNDKKDINDLLDGKIQGLVRGSLVGFSLLKKYPKLGMIKPWKTKPNLVTKDEEVFAFPCKVGSGVSQLLSSFLTYMIVSGELNIIKQEFL